MIVAFDLGGVVVDVDKAHLAGTNDCFFGARHDQLSIGTLSAEDYVLAVAEDLRWDVRRVVDAWRRVVRFSAGGLELLRAVKAPVHIWSNTDPLHWSVLSRHLSHCPRALSFEIGAQKPDAAFYSFALRGLVASEVLYLDDRPENVAAAAEVGVDAVVVEGVAAARAVLRQRGVL